MDENFKLGKVYKNKRRFDELLAVCKNNNVDHWTIESGSTKTVNSDFRNFSLIEKRFNKTHVIKDVNKEVWKIIDFVPKIKGDYMLSCCDSENLSKCKPGASIFGFDIKNCYWATLHNLGYINYEMFIKYIDPEYKNARNAAVGSFIMKKIYKHYMGSYHIKEDNRIEEKDIRLSYVRNHILNHVWGKFKPLIDSIGGEFLMFFTDAIYTTINVNAKEIYEYFRNEGYHVELKYYDLDKVEYLNEYNNILVQWFDYEAERKYKAEKDEKIKKGIIYNKLYTFNRRQYYNI